MPEGSLSDIPMNSVAIVPKPTDEATNASKPPISVVLTSSHDSERSRKFLKDQKKIFKTGVVSTDLRGRLAVLLDICRRSNPKKSCGRSQLFSSGNIDAVKDSLPTKPRKRV
jgi:hypothetical protein